MKRLVSPIYGAYSINTKKMFRMSTRQEIRRKDHNKIDIKPVKNIEAAIAVWQIQLNGPNVLTLEKAEELGKSMLLNTFKQQTGKVPDLKYTRFSYIGAKKTPKGKYVRYSFKAYCETKYCK